MNNITITEFKDIRVLTTQQLADQYETDSKTISNNFNRNKDRYREGKHYILLQGEELKAFKTNHQFDESSRVNQLYLWTEKGCLLQAKSLGTDKAWETYENLVDTYFAAKDIFAGLTEEMKVLLSHDKKIKIVLEHMEKTDDRMDKLEFDIPLYGCEAKELSDHVKRKGVQVLGGKKSNAYNDSGVRSEVYRDIYDQIKREFGLNDETGRKQTYLALKRKYLADAHECIDAYQAPIVLQEKIQDTNNQVNISDIALKRRVVMFWIILGVICVIAIIVGICVAAFCEWHDVEGVATAVIAGGVLLLLVLCAPVIAAQDKQEINQFKNQKEYIENHEVKDSIENASLTTKKIELNAWLIDTQYAKVHYSFFTFLPDEVMELTPIN